MVAHTKKIIKFESLVIQTIKSVCHSNPGLAGWLFDHNVVTGKMKEASWSPEQALSTFNARRAVDRIQVNYSKSYYLPLQRLSDGV